MSRDYPTDVELKTVETWEFKEPGSFTSFMQYVRSIGHYWPNGILGWTQAGRTYSIATGGWSGNEDIIEAMQRNDTFWTVCWLQSRRGGHFMFELPDDVTYYNVTPQAAKGTP